MTATIRSTRAWTAACLLTLTLTGCGWLVDPAAEPESNEWDFDFGRNSPNGDFDFGRNSPNAGDRDSSDTTPVSTDPIDWCAVSAPDAPACARIDSPRGCEYGDPTTEKWEVESLSLSAVPPDCLSSDLIYQRGLVANCLLEGGPTRLSLGGRQHFLWLADDLTTSYAGAAEGGRTPMQEVGDSQPWEKSTFKRVGQNTAVSGTYRVVYEGFGYPLPVVLRHATMTFEVSDGTMRGVIRGAIDPAELWASQRALAETCRAYLRIEESSQCVGFALHYRNGYEHDAPDGCRALEAVNGLGIAALLADVDVDHDGRPDHMSATIDFEAVLRGPGSVEDRRVRR